MEGLISPVTAPNTYFILSTWTTFKFLIVALTCTFITWYIQFLWNMRNLYKHSRNIPGPFSLPLIGSPWYFLGMTDILTSITALFNTYPGLGRFWFGTKLIYGVSDPRYLEIILPNHLKREPKYHLTEIIVGQGLFSNPDVEKWRRHRKLISATFNQKILDGFVEVFTEQGEVLLEQLKKYSGKGEIDLFRVMSNCTLDTICETAMGVKVNAQTSNALFSSWVDKGMEIIFQRAFTVWYYIDFIFNMTEQSKILTDSCKNIHDFTSKVVQEKKQAHALKKQYTQEFNHEFNEGGRQRKAFLDYLIEIAVDQNGSFTEQELREEVDTFIVAGSDTTSTTLCFCFTMLGLYPELQEKVYQEIIDILGHERQPESSDLPNMKYLEMFIKETLRLFPVAPVIFRLVEEDVDLGDCIIPSGTSVCIGILHIHRNENYWPNVLKFIPERFLPEEVAKRHPCVYVPFSYGPRNCIAQKYALMGLKTIVSTVIRKFKIFTDYKSIEEIQLTCNIVLRPKDGFKVSVRAR